MMLSMLILILSGCKKDPATVTQDPPLELQEPNIPGIMMTLSAISYVAEKLEPKIIRDSIDILLNDRSLGTRGLWQRAWGPGISSNIANSVNLVYVARLNTLPNPTYAIVIRGTNMANKIDSAQDVDVFTQVQFKYGETGDLVARGAMNGLDTLLLTKDFVTKKTLETFLDSIKRTTKTTLFITGHSQGGYLAPLMAYWVMKDTSFKDMFTVRTYTFAAPGIVNKQFKDNFMTTLQQQSGSIKMIVNSLDVIPYFWTDLPGIIDKHIPVAVPAHFSDIYTLAEIVLKGNGITYYNVAPDSAIGSIPVIPPQQPQTKEDSIAYYKKWAEVEHYHNNYLYLLGEPPLPF